MPYRLFLCLTIFLAAVAPALSEDASAHDESDVADCTWQPFKIFTNGYIKAPSGGAKDERLYLRKEPSYTAILPGTAPFDWSNATCNLWPGMALRVADWGGPKDRFAKLYYDGLVFWVSKTYRDGSPTMLSISAQSAAEPAERSRKR